MKKLLAVAVAVVAVGCSEQSAQQAARTEPTQKPSPTPVSLEVLKPAAVPGPLSAVKQTEIVKCDRKGDRVVYVVMTSATGQIRVVIDFESKGDLVTSKSADLMGPTATTFEVVGDQMSKVTGCRLATAIR